MSESDDRTTGRIRAGDADRDRVVERLRHHHEAGRLSAEEFNERMEAALQARYLDELPPLLTDLPEKADQAADRDGAAPRHCAWGGWSAPASHPGREASRRRPFVPLLPLVAVLAVAASFGAGTHGHFPWPILWIALLVLWLRPRRSRWARTGHWTR